MNSGVLNWKQMGIIKYFISLHLKVCMKFCEKKKLPITQKKKKPKESCNSK